MNSENDLPRLQVLTESTARFAREFIETQGGTVQGGSPGDVEAADPDYGDLSRRAHLYGVMQLVAAHDSIGALGPVMASGTGVYSLSVLARAGLEASGRAGWLLEVGLGARRRAERALSEQLYSLTQRRTALNAILERVRRQPERVERTRQQLDRVAAQRQELLTLGHSLNLTPVPGGKKKEVVAFGEARPSGTAVAAQILSAAGMEAGGDVYRLFSGSTHATVAALATQFEEGPEIAPGVRMANVTMTLAQLHTSVAIPLWGWSEALIARFIIWVGTKTTGADGGSTSSKPSRSRSPSKADGIEGSGLTTPEALTSSLTQHDPENSSRLHAPGRRC